MHVRTVLSLNIFSENYCISFIYLFKVYYTNTWDKTNKICSWCGRKQLWLGAGSTPATVTTTTSATTLSRKLSRYSWLHFFLANQKATIDIAFNWFLEIIVAVSLDNLNFSFAWKYCQYLPSKERCEMLHGWMQRTLNSILFC